jgi:hypothetical protein
VKRKSKGGLEISTFQKLYMLSQKKQIFFLQKVALAMLLLLPLSYLLPQTSEYCIHSSKVQKGGVLFLGVLPILAKSIGVVTSSSAMSISAKFIVGV